MMTCPCCSDTLLRHARRGESYLLCQRCRMEVPMVQTEEVDLRLFTLQQNLTVPMTASLSSVVADLVV